MNRHKDINPLSSKGALNRMANKTIYPYYFSENKEIRGKYEWYALLLRELPKNKGLTTVAKTLLLPHSTNKTTSVVAENDARTHQPHYLIKNEVNEGLRSIMRCETSKATVVVLSEKLGGNEVMFIMYQFCNSGKTGRNVETWCATSLPRVRDVVFYQHFVPDGIMRCADGICRTHILPKVAILTDCPRITQKNLRSSVKSVSSVCQKPKIEN